MALFRKAKKFVKKYDEDYLGALKSAREVAAAAKQIPQGPKFGVATGSIPVKDAAGKRAKFSAYIRTAGITPAIAALANAARLVSPSSKHNQEIATVTNTGPNNATSANPGDRTGPLE